jgi:hypothetical protein
MLLVLALVTALTGACGSKPGPVQPAASDDTAGAAGLEVIWWMMRDPDGEHAGRVLASSARTPVPAPQGQVLRWWSAGLRVVRVGTAELDALRAALRVMPPVQETRMGVNPRWVVLASGLPWSGWRGLEVDGEEVRLPGGRMRLLARAWLCPSGMDGSARLRVDLLPQHVPGVDPDDLDAVRRRLGLTPRLDTAGEGPCLARLALELELSDGEVVLVVPDRPGHVWKGWEAAASEPTSREDVGPFAPDAPDLGGLLLTDWSNPSGVSLRVIVVLRAHVPRRFELLPAG